MEQIYYQYSKIELTQFAVFEENFPSGMENVQFNSELQFGYSKEQFLLFCEITVTMASDGKPLMKAVMRSYFTIAQDSIRQIKDEYGHIEFPPSVLVQFASLNYGSLRGAIFIKTQGLPMSSYVLPPVFFNQIIDKPFVVNN